ncbi:acetyl-CoA carboxylase biotin carboxylase subunit [Sneathiella sp. P13V-1]|uniref:acetyl/propionyl/methylcrotonyl-CoA carboxylase subunit alpha n=1 Tax=Sneathiella sp. P13V-1 TaxID=2697366 RepID=UPI00187B5C42|nr:acetyl-CoA carboxylase biotin carboxylase subunit [Sneathiella sp. P13V-1]MBE7635374.1 acetyl-CoA carboxylase biotin carboxylase subunit [Sneathiella sp. P13V-1]
MSRFSKILIANRGEIACRVIRTAHEMGYSTVAVYSEADADALHVAMADEAVLIGPAPVGESYLDMDRIFSAAEVTGADAIHPGYGFLSENAAFAKACEERNITFIGPSEEAIDVMGNKAEAKRRMIDAGVPCVPGYEGEDQSDSHFIKAADEIGFPVMVKAAAGGGGRGMRLVAKPEKLEKALATARSEAENAFGSGELILEKAVIEPRHIEIQVFADSHGNVVHLGERDCSIQRRHQKVIEEAPSPAVSEELRQKMGAAAVAAAKAINYRGAGTVEFLLGADGSFYFLEMNTRLQVEHPVTECITGFDLVEWQLRVARGEVLPSLQDDIVLFGHAIEARLYAEDPYKDFLPRVGTLVSWRPAIGEGLRCDHGLVDGIEITPHYDAMIAKVIAYGESREDARLRLIRSLEQTQDLGLTTNRQFLIDCLKHDAFTNGEATTGFIESYFPKKTRTRPEPTKQDIALAASLLFAIQQHDTGSDTDGWDSAAINISPMVVEVGENKHSFQIQQNDLSSYLVRAGEEEWNISFLDEFDTEIRVLLNGVQKTIHFAEDTDLLHIAVGALTFSAREVTLAPAGSADGAGDGRIAAPMNGRVIDILVKAGDKVEKGQIVAMLEAMKMEHEIPARISGTVTSIGAKKDDQVASKAMLVEIEAEEDA